MGTELKNIITFAHKSLNAIVGRAALQSIVATQLLYKGVSNRVRHSFLPRKEVWRRARCAAATVAYGLPYQKRVPHLMSLKVAHVTAE